MPVRNHAPEATISINDWRCRRCDRLLGVHRGDRIHIHFKRGAEYLASRPVTATCRGCGALNNLN